MLNSEWNAVLFFVIVTIGAVGVPCYDIIMERVMSRRREDERLKIIREDILYAGYHKEYASGRITERQFRKLCKMDAVKHQLDGLVRPKNRLKELRNKLYAKWGSVLESKKKEESKPISTAERLKRLRVT